MGYTCWGDALNNGEPAISSTIADWVGNLLVYDMQKFNQGVQLANPIRIKLTACGVNSEGLHNGESFDFGDATYTWTAPEEFDGISIFNDTINPSPFLSGNGDDNGSEQVTLDKYTILANESDEDHVNQDNIVQALSHDLNLHRRYPLSKVERDNIIKDKAEE